MLRSTMILHSNMQHSSVGSFCFPVLWSGHFLSFVLRKLISTNVTPVLQLTFYFECLAISLSLLCFVPMGPVRCKHDSGCTTYAKKAGWLCPPRDKIYRLQTGRPSMRIRINFDCGYDVCTRSVLSKVMVCLSIASSALHKGQECFQRWKKRGHS
jgi:hypothetical protein